MHRDTGIDVVRSTYIIMMIVYHCFTQANKLDPGFVLDINRYLILVSGSFPFLAGFLIGYHYLRQSFTGAIDTASRLFIRGSRLLLLYLVSNVVIIYVLSKLKIEGVINSSDDHLMSIFTVNSSEVIYDILVPLGLILMTGALLVYIASKNTGMKYQKLYYIFPAVIGLVLAFDGRHPYMACGLLGIALGNNLIDGVIVSVYSRYRAIVYVSLLYGLSLAIVYDDLRYSGAFYLVGVITLFYAVRSFKQAGLSQVSIIANELVLYSRYSLFIYLVHVPLIIIIVTQSIVPIDMFPSVFVFTVLLLIVFISMSFLIRLVDRLYVTSNNFKKLYNFVFG